MIVGKRGGWRIKPGVYVKEVDRSAMFSEQDIDEIRESIVKACGIPKKYLIGEEDGT